MTSLQNILFIGASGFIGKALCRHLSTVCPGVNLHALARSTSDVAPFVQKHIVSDWSLRGITKNMPACRFDVIFNLAAAGVSPDERELDVIHAVNTALPSTLVQLAYEHGASLIHAGSSAEYAPSDDLFLDEINSPVGAYSLYGASKAAGGMMAYATAKHLNVDFLNLRLFNVFGEGEASHRLFPSLVRAAETAQPLPLSDGLQIRDFIHVKQVCRAFELAASSSNHKPRQAVLNVCSGIAVSVRDFSKTIFKVLSADENLLEFGAIERRPDDLLRVVGKPDRAAAQIAFEASSPLEIILRDAFNQKLEAA